MKLSTSFLTPSLRVIMIFEFIQNLGLYAIVPFLPLLFLNFGFSTGLIGLIVGARALTYVTGMMLGGELSDRNRVKQIFLYSMILSAVGYVSLYEIRTPMLFLAALSCIGLFSGIAYSAGSKLIVVNSETGKLPEVYATLRTLLNIAVSIAPLLAIALFLEEPGPSFLVFAAVQIAYALAVAKKVRRDTEPVTSALGARPTISLWGDYKHVLLDRKFMVRILALFLSGVSYASIETTLPLFLKFRFAEPANWYALILIMNTILVATLQIFLAKLAKRAGYVRAIQVGQLLYASTFTLVALSANLALIVLAFVLFTFGEMLISPSAYSLTVINSRFEHLGKYQALANMRTQLALPVCAFLGGLIAPVGQGTLMMIMYALFAFAGVATLSSVSATLRTRQNSIRV